MEDQVADPRTVPLGPTESIGIQIQRFRISLPAEGGLECSEFLPGFGWIVYDNAPDELIDSVLLAVAERAQRAYIRRIPRAD